ncbi:hypothetical protein PO909_026462 [Leuciscus waleckii]
MKICKMEICDVTPARLWITGGEKCVSVEVRCKSHHQLVTQNLQDGHGHEGVVQVFEIIYEERKCMAFCFEVGDKAIFPFTDGKDIHFTVLSSIQEVMKDTVNKTLNEMFLFQWGEAGTSDWRSLKSVAEPSMYLFSEDNGNKVTIKPVEMPHFKIQKKGITRTSKFEKFFIPNKLNMKTPYATKGNYSYMCRLHFYIYSLYHYFPFIIVFSFRYPDMFLKLVTYT